MLEYNDEIHYLFVRVQTRKRRTIFVELLDIDMSPLVLTTLCFRFKATERWQLAVYINHINPLGNILIYSWWFVFFWINMNLIYDLCPSQVSYVYTERVIDPNSRKYMNTILFWKKFLLYFLNSTIK